MGAPWWVNGRPVVARWWLRSGALSVRWWSFCPQIALIQTVVQAPERDDAPDCGFHAWTARVRLEGHAPLFYAAFEASSQTFGPRRLLGADYGQASPPEGERFAVGRVSIE